MVSAGLLSVAGSAWSQAQSSSGATEKAIAALENTWLQSQKTNNPDLVAPLLADKFVSTDSDGKVTNKTRCSRNQGRASTAVPSTTMCR